MKTLMLFAALVCLGVSLWLIQCAITRKEIIYLLIGPPIYGVAGIGFLIMGLRRVRDQ